MRQIDPPCCSRRVGARIWSGVLLIAAGILLAPAARLQAEDGPTSSQPATVNSGTRDLTTPARKKEAAALRAPIMRRLESGPAVFIENRGQFDPQVRFQVRSGGKTLWLTNKGIVFDAIRAKAADAQLESGNPKRGVGSSKIGNVQSAITNRLIPDPESLAPAFSPRTPNPQPRNYERLVFSEDFVGGSTQPRIEVTCPEPGIYNYFIGNDPKKWVKDARGYSQVVYHDVWKGVDLKLYGNGSNIEQEFSLRPGADPSQIQVAYRGIEGLEVAQNGSLVVHTAFGDLRESKPRIYQEIAGKRVAVEGHFKLASSTTYSFEVEPYRNEYALVIDPTLLYSTYLGGSGQDQANGIAVDSAGYAYVTGLTGSPNFPTTSGAFQTNFAAFFDFAAFVTKVNPLGSGLIYSTYLAPSVSYQTYTTARGIAVDSVGEAYITGTAPQNFPTTANAFQTSCAYSTFLTKLNANGDGLVYSTCLGEEGGAGIDYGAGGQAIAIDTSDKASVTGWTAGGFPVTSTAFQPTMLGIADVFVAVVDPAASGSSSLLYSTYLGGPPIPGISLNAGFTGQSFGSAIAVDGYGMLYVAGSTNSNQFPVTPGAFQTVFAGPPDCAFGATGIIYGTDAFVAKLNPSASGVASLIYSTYLSGSGGASASGISVDSSGDAYVAGGTEACRNNSTSATSPPFPTTAGAFQPDIGINPDAFLTKLNAAGNGLIYSTVLGDHTTHWASGASAVTVDSSGHAYVVGGTRSPNGFPVTPNAFQTSNQGGGGSGYNAFVTQFNASGSALVYSSQLGGSGDDSAAGVTIDSVGDVYLTGYADSLNFPVTGHAFQARTGGGACQAEPTCDAFVTKFPLGAPQGLSITGMTPNAGGNAGSITPQIVGAGFHAGASVKLTGAGADIIGTGVTVGLGGRTLSATFDLTSAQPATADLVVTNPDGTSATLSNALTIQQGGAPNIHVYKIGTVAQKPPLDQPTWSTNVTYYITVTNTGNIDVTNGFVSELLDREFSLTSVNPSAIADVATLAADSFILWNVPVLSPGESLQFTYSAMIDASTPVGSKIVGGPGCFLDPLGLYDFSICIANHPSQCGPAVAFCSATAITCPPTLPPSFLLPNPAYNLPVCSRTLPGCIRRAGNCLPVVTQCLSQSAHSCDSFIQQLLGGPVDPNYLVGVSGAGPQHWIPAAEALTYVIGFGNEAAATAPAQQVVVTQPLGPNVNLSTLRLSGVTIPSNTNGPSIQVTIPSGAFNPVAGLDEFVTNVDRRPTQDLLVNVDAKLNSSTNTITWTLTSIDPATGQPPTNAGVGFLPPGAEGNVFFIIAPKPGLPTGTAVSDQANVVFSNSGINDAPVSTNTWLNTLDSTPPASRVLSLPSVESCANFVVKWSGTDVGSGIQDFTIFASEDGGSFTAWQTNTTATSATFKGEAGHSYAFYSIARDLVGNVESAKASAEATTEVNATPTCGTGVPSLSGRIVSKSLSGTTLAVNLQLTDTGTADARNVQISQFALRTLGGTGTATYPGLTPLKVGNLAMGASTTIPLTIAVPATVTKFSITENGTLQDSTGKTYNFSIGQVVYP